MRCIYNDSFCLRCDLLLKLSKIRLEGCGIRRDFHKDTIIITDICTVLQEIWCKNDHFFFRIQDCLQNHVQSACCSNCHDQVLCRKFRIKALVEGFCNSLAYILKTCIAHITVKNSRICPINKLNDRLTYTIRSRHTRVSKAEVKYLICAVFRTETVAFLKHHTDGRIVFYIGFHFF